MKYSLLFTVAAAVVGFNSFSQAQEMPACSDAGKALFEEIQVYKATVEVNPAAAVVGPRLKYDLSLAGSTASVSDLEAGFAKCIINFTPEEDLALQKKIESAKAEVLRQP